MEKLFSPFTVKNIRLKNRIVMPPLASFLIGDDGGITDATIDHYRRRAAGGPAMLEAAVAGAHSGASGETPRVVAVTVLTSLDEYDLAGLGVARSPANGGLSSHSGSGPACSVVLVAWMIGSRLAPSRRGRGGGRRSARSANPAAGRGQPDAGRCRQLDARMVHRACSRGECDDNGVAAARRGRSRGQAADVLRRRSANGASTRKWFRCIKGSCCMRRPEGG